MPQNISRLEQPSLIVQANNLLLQGQVIPFEVAQFVTTSNLLGVYCLDLNGIATYCNDIAATALGYTTGEVLGLPMHEIMHHTKPNGAAYDHKDCPIYAAFRDGLEHQVSNEVLWCKDGSNVHVTYISRPIWHGQKVTGAIVLFAHAPNRLPAMNDTTR